MGWWRRFPTRKWIKMAQGRKAWRWVALAGVVVMAAGVVGGVLWQRRVAGLRGADGEGGTPRP
ncbi:MAG: hypothetical protein KatS3mg132_416 [Limisphaera sp.]|nr:MAG: hypothetical protein KatS3mg132_416 [Limisphaera sp.]